MKRLAGILLLSPINAYAIETVTAGVTSFETWILGLLGAICTIAVAIHVMNAIHEGNPDWRKIINIGLLYGVAMGSATMFAWYN